MLGLLRKTLALELHSFYAKINKQFKKVTTSAFVQNRHKVKPALFYEINRLVASDYYVDNEANVNLFKNHRLLAVDGSTANLPVNENTIEHYGLFNNQKGTNDIVIGRISVLYDVLNNIVLDGLLSHYKKGEVPLFQAHLSFIEANDLLILDRMYPSFDAAWRIRQKQAHFLFRCKTTFNNLTKGFSQSSKKEWITELQPSQHKSLKHLPYDKNERIKVRFLKVELESGETEILMTSLLNKKKYPANEFKVLYFQRWGVETFYDRFKNLIEVERFSGKNHQFIQQEFNCALYISNMQTILTQDIDVEKQVKAKYRGRKLVYKVNQSISLGFIREKLIEIFVLGQKESEQLLEELKQLFVLNVIPKRPNRKYKREPDKYRQRTKPKQFGNRRLLL